MQHIPVLTAFVCLEDSKITLIFLCSVCLEQFLLW
jgi:hypothetical protein